jgi:CRISPR/Cas system-associated exonuclease Cas4 (RecB family)
MQLDFFDIGKPIEEEISSISWSPSKMNAARQCSRRFYYQYYGSKKSKAKTDADKERLQFLSNFSNKNLVAGEIVHAVIATYFRKAKLNEVWSFDRMRNFAFHILQQAIQYSKSVRAGGPLQVDYPPSIFKEIFYQTLDESVIIAEVRGKVETNLKNFALSDKFEHLRKGGKSISSVIEEKAKFELVKGIKIDGVIDIAFDDSGTFRIADWKTGKVEEEDTSLQLLTYALWAAEKKSLKESIIIEKAYLAEDRLEKLEYSDVHLGRARVRIIQDVEVLREMHDFGLDGNSQAFTKCDKPKICALCPFQEVCDKNK